jgi:hypothetical protein
MAVFHPPSDSYKGFCLLDSLGTIISTHIQWYATVISADHFFSEVAAQDFIAVFDSNADKVLHIGEYFGPFTLCVPESA